MARRDSQSMRDMVRKNSKESSNKGLRYILAPEGVGFVKVKADGKLLLNILPYEVTLKNHPDGMAIGTNWYKRPFKLHRNVGVDNALVICPTSIGKKCPICEYQKELYDKGNTDPDTLRKLRPSERVLYAVEVISGQKETGLHLLEISSFAFQKKLDAEINDPENEDFAGFADVEGGYSLRVRFAEATTGTFTYATAERIDFVKREDEISQKMLKNVPALDECLNILPYEEIKRIFLEIDDEDKDENDSPPKRTPKEEDEDEDEPITKKKQTKDEDEDDEPPKRKREVNEDEDEPTPPKKRPPVDDDDEPPAKRKSKDEDEDEPPISKRPPKEEDDDDDPPKRRGRPPTKKGADEDEDEPKRKKSESGCPKGFKLGDAAREKTAHPECEECPTAKYKECLAAK